MLRFLNRRFAGIKAPPVKFEKTVHHGQQRMDPFAFLQNINCKDSIQYIKAENRHYDKYMRRLGYGKSDTLWHQMSKSIERANHLYLIHGSMDEIFHQTDSSLFIMRNHRLYRKDKYEQLIFDHAEIDGEVTRIKISPDGSYLAYVEHSPGKESGELFVKNLSNSELISVSENALNIVWLNDKLLYTISDSNYRPFQVFIYDIKNFKSKLIYTEKDDRFFVDISITKDSKYGTININSRTSTEVYLVSNTSNDVPVLKLVQSRTENMEYYVDHCDSHLYIVSNYQPGLINDSQFTLYFTHDSQPESKYWRPLIKLNDFDHLEDIDLFQKFVAIYIRRNGLSRILIYEFPSDKEQNLTNGKLNELHVPHEISEISSAQNLDIKSDLFNFSCSVIGKHESTYTCNYSDLSISTKKIVGFHNISTDNYMLKHGFIQIPHNNRNNQTLLNIPCTFAHHISVDFPFDLDKDFIFRSKNNLQPTSLLLEVYGSYGTNLSHPICPLRHIPLLDEKIVLGSVHVRGGSELGRLWYNEARGSDKKYCTIHDLNQVSRYIRQSFESQNKLLKMGLLGTSSGGFAVGNVIWNQMEKTDSKYIFDLAVLKVPFLDPITSMCNSKIPLTTTEYEEWGNPSVSKQDYLYLLNLSPYDNLNGLEFSRQFKVPSIYLSGGVLDQRVSYWHPLKWAAKVRELNFPGLMIVNIDENAGHESSIQNIVDTNSFIVKTLKL